MSIEKALIHRIAQPWGRVDLWPWGAVPHGDQRIGELRFERSNPSAKPPLLLLKLLFTDMPMSVKVSANDEAAASMGVANGKSEAWLVLKADSDARIGLGVAAPISAQRLRAAIDDGTVADLLAWRPTRVGDAALVPAGTLHAIGAGMIVAEVEQRSEASFALADVAANQDINVEAVLAVADLRPLPAALPPIPRNSVRTVLVESPDFVLERAWLPPGSSWRINVRHENWLLVLAGDLSSEELSFAVGEGAFMNDGTTDMAAGPAGAEVLLAYVGSSAQNNLLKPIPRLVRSTDKASSGPLLERLAPGYLATSRNVSG